MDFPEEVTLKGHQYVEQHVSCMLSVLNITESGGGFRTLSYDSGEITFAYFCSPSVQKLEYFCREVYAHVDEKKQPQSWMVWLALCKNQKRAVFFVQAVVHSYQLFHSQDKNDLRFGYHQEGLLLALNQMKAVGDHECTPL